VAELSDFYPHILPEVPGCPNIVVDFAINNTLNDFCTVTRLWSQTLTPISSVADQMDYTVAAVTGADFVRFERVAFDGVPLTQRNLDQLDGLYPAGWADLTGTPLHCVTNSDGSLSLVPAPAAVVADGIKIRASLAPSATGTTFPDLLFRRYSVEIAAGVKASLMSMAGKPWSNPDMALTYSAIYESGRSDAMTFEARGKGRAKVRTLAQFF
jgi:hypothetical protein